MWLFSFVLPDNLVIYCSTMGNAESWRQAALEGYATCRKSVVRLHSETKSIHHRRLKTVKLFVLSRVLFI